MAITFEEKNNTVKTLVIMVLLVVFLLLAGFLVWKFFLRNPPSVAVINPGNEKIDKNLLKDARIDSLDLFPQIAPSAIPAGKINPFSEGNATTTVNTEVKDVSQPVEP